MLVDRPDPEPGPGEVLIAPQAVGVCATDLELYDGVMAYYRTGQASYPLIPGHEWSGEVVAVGSGVKGLREGDRVVGEVSVGCGRCDQCRAGRYHVCANAQETGIMGREGALATRLVHPETATFAFPAALSWAAAALIEPTSVALYAARRGNCRGRRVAVLGAGTIGSLALQCARADGASWTLAANPSPRRLGLARELGADATLVIPSDPVGAAGALRRAAGDRGIAVVLVCTGAPAAIATAIEAVDPAGTLVLAGLTGESTLPIDVDRIVTKDLDVQGVNGSPGLWPETIALVASGRVRTEPLVSHRVGLQRAVEAFELVRARAPGTHKVIIEPQL